MNAMHVLGYSAATALFGIVSFNAGLRFGRAGTKLGAVIADFNHRADICDAADMASDGTDLEYELQP